MCEYEVKFVFKRDVEQPGEVIESCVLSDNIANAIEQARSIFEKQLEGHDYICLFFLSIEEVQS